MFLQSVKNAVGGYVPKLTRKFPLTTPRSSQVKKIPEVGTKVVTDIDDTVKSSGGVRLFGIPLGGIDVRLIKLLL